MYIYIYTYIYIYIYIYIIYSSFVCITAYANVYFQTTFNRGPLRECRSIRSGASGLPYYCAPLVCVSEVIQSLAVWWYYKPKTKNQNPRSGSAAGLWLHRSSIAMDAGAGLRCDAPEPDATVCKTLVHSEVDSPMRRSIAPSVRGAHPEGHCPATLTNEPAPSGRGAHPKGHCLSTLTNEPVPLGRLAHPKGHRASTLTNEPAQLCRGPNGVRRFGDFEWCVAASSQPLSS